MIRSSRSSKATAPGPTSGARACACSTPPSRRFTAASGRSSWLEVLAGEKAQGTVRRVAARRHARGVQGVTSVAIKGPLYDAGRRRDPQPQRDASPGARSVRLHPTGALLRGRRHPMKQPEKHERRDLPREHRRRVRGHRVGEGHPRGRKAHRVHSAARWARTSVPDSGDRHQADVGVRLEAARPDGAPVRHREQPQDA